MLETLGPAPRLMVDIGANIGVFALVALARGHFVVAFEPVKRYASAVLVPVYCHAGSQSKQKWADCCVDCSHVEMLQRAAAVNGWGDRLLVFNNILAAHCGAAMIAEAGGYIIVHCGCIHWGCCCHFTLTTCRHSTCRSTVANMGSKAFAVANHATAVQ
jgi:hypothetical protein